MPSTKLFGFDIRLVFAVMVLVAASLSFIAFDRAPLLPLSDEVIQNDPALTLAQTGELRAASYEGTPIGERFAHYPPLYILLQSAVFSIFGLSVWSLRGLALLAHTVSLGLLAVCVWNLIRRNRLGAWLGLAAFAICAFDVSLMVLSRWGRMEPVMAAFALGAWAILTAHDFRSDKRWLWLAAGLLLGVSAATHPSAIWFISPFVAAVLIAYRKPWVERIGFAILPFAVAAAIWAGVYREASFDALAQFLELNRLQGFHGVSLEKLSDAFSALDLRVILQQGGVALALVLAAMLGSCIAGLMELRRRQSALIAIVSIAALANLIFAFAFIGISITRVYGLLQVSVLSAALLLNGTGFSRMAIRSGFAVALIGFLLCGAYLARAFDEYELRDPVRAEAIVDSIDSSVRVAVAPTLWFAFKSQGRSVQVIDYGFAPSKRYWAGQTDFGQWDVIVLKADHPLLASPALAERVQTPMQARGETYIRLDKPDVYLASRNSDSK